MIYESIRPDALAALLETHHPDFNTCLTGARRWLERGLEEAERLNDAEFIDGFVGLICSFDQEASDLFDAIAEANDPPLSREDREAQRGDWLADWRKERA